MRNVGQLHKLGEGPEVVTPGGLGEFDHARARVARRALWVEGDMAVGVARGQDEQIDATCLGEVRVIGERVGRVGDPQVSRSNPATCRRRGGERAHDFLAGEALNRVVQGRVDASERLTVTLDVVIHHHDDHVRKIQ